MRLPSDDELLIALERNGWWRAATAAQLGCTPSAVSKATRRIEARQGPLPRPQGARQPSTAVMALAERVGLLETLVLELATSLRMAHGALAVRADLDLIIADLEERVATLEARPIGLFRPNHRRLSEGGTTVRSQLRAARG